MVALSEIQAEYRTLLGHAKTDLLQQFERLRQAFRCASCIDVSTETLLRATHPGCGYTPWRQQVLEILEQHLGRELVEKLAEIRAECDRVTCGRCGACCRMASSEYDWVTLSEKARQGDDFARQFTRVFLPYTSVEAARQANASMVEDVLATAGVSPDSGKTVYFYHCPYIDEDNRCTLFNDPRRPAMCGSYPETPLTFVSRQCAWKPWQEAHHSDTLLVHGLTELCQHWASQVRAALT